MSKNRAKGSRFRQDNGWQSIQRDSQTDALIASLLRNRIAGFDILTEVPGQAVWPKIRLNWPSYAQSRPLLERTLRRQVERMANITVRGRCRVLNIVSESNIGAATGIQCQLVDGRLETLESDLVVDASGNGSLTVEFLKSSGRRAPEETSIDVNIRYASAVFVRSPILNDYKIVFTLPDSPDQGRGGIILPVENNCNHVVLSASSKDIPPIDGNGFLGYARQLPTVTIYNAIKNAKRLTDIAPFTFPGSRWRHFAHVSDFPRGCFQLGTQFVALIPLTGKE